MKSLIYLLIIISTTLFSQNYFKYSVNIYKPHTSIKNNKIFKIKSKINNNAQSFLDSIINEQKTIKTVIIKAKVDIRKKFLRIKGDMLIYMVSPNKILIKTSVLGINISKLLISGNKLYFRDNIKNTLKIRQANRKNISRYIPIKLSLQQFKEMLKGAPPIINYNSINLNSDKTELILKNNYENQYLKFNSKGEIIKMTLFQNNKKRINIKFSKIRYKNGYSYASKILFKDYKKSVKSKMTITSIEFNKKLNNNIFEALK